MKSAARGADGLQEGLERAVFQSLYQSRAQYWHRKIALALLIIKHMVRGLMVVWPIYLLLIVLMVIPKGQYYGLYFIALLPGLIFWIYVFIRGAMRDYARVVKGRLLNKGYVARLLFK
jgi:hypothetical protein